MWVTPVGYQQGAALVAKARKVTLATLNADATETDYMLRVAERLFAGVSARGGIVLGVGDRLALSTTCKDQAVRLWAGSTPSV